MLRAVADTHAVIWYIYVSRDRRIKLPGLMTIW